MADKYKKNDGNKYRNQGDNYAEGVLRNRSEQHKAQNSPARPHNR
ncbi:hypothetical protein ACFPVX_04585 [Cohnella faecalis]|nr:hypothetical protein [Cohnella faecalis]